MSGLEVIGGTAAISQLLGQAITVIKHIQDARAKVHGASGCLDNYQSQLDNLLDTLQLVQDEPELHTPPIKKQVQKIIDMGKELQRLVDAFAALMTGSKMKQYTHAFTAGDRDEKGLENAMRQLDRAKAELTAMIVTTHVGLSSSMHTGFTAALAVAQKVDRNVQRVLGERLSMSTYLEGRCSDKEENNTVSLTAEDIKALDRKDKASWVNCEAFGKARMFNADSVQRQNHMSTERLYSGTKAYGNSTVFQGNATGADIVAFIRATNQTGQ
ncbi:hypothetical protein BDW02DRAFT_633698 [Decorospora gaudefroyi]|uniref:Uncharacterized protein n=1 Tax=Decorospora gaudefroyi TaxID=184978 RepID=A0A6A5KAL6_9PLEO|nr:hypothetical protein BDW02DRAFT_633698 [Decorospora gaudefroyi]